ncbi:MAG: c-type cytochrome [Aquabacterium sp.]
MRARATALCAWVGLLGPLGPAAATGAQPVDTTLGRMVPARADAPSVGATGSARARFVLHCAGCHGVDGRGPPDSGVPDLRRIDAFLRLDGGRAFLIRVPGVMGSGLGDAEVAEVANWMLAALVRRPMPDGHRPYDAAEVARARAAPLKDVATERARLAALAQAAGTPLHGY